MDLQWERVDDEEDVVQPSSDKLEEKSRSTRQLFIQENTENDYEETNIIN